MKKVVFVIVLSIYCLLLSAETKISPEIVLPKGYRGFFDLGYGIGIEGEKLDLISFSTSHGYQFNPYLFLGVGGGLNYVYGIGNVYIPVFLNTRIDYPKQQASPFLDLRIGGMANQQYGIYLAPSIGIRFNSQKIHSANISVGYSYQKAEKNVTYGVIWTSGYREKTDLHNINIKFGFEF